MRTTVYVLASLTIAGFVASAGAQNTGNPTPSRAQAPVRQPTTSPPAAAPMPSPRTSPTPAQPTQPNSATPTQTQPVQPARPMPTNPNSTTQQTVFPPDSRIDPNNPANNPAQRANPANNVQQRVPPASRGVGQQGRPDCSKLRGLEKSECERRDTSRDDLPAGVTSTQPEK